LWSEALKVTRAIRDESNRVKILRLLPSKLSPDLWEQALEIASTMQNISQHAEALIALAPRNSELWRKALDVVRTIPDESQRAEILSAMAWHLPSELWLEVLDLTQQIQDESQRAKALKNV
jgi:hypothetical protein